MHCMRSGIEIQGLLNRTKKDKNPYPSVQALLPVFTARHLKVEEQDILKKATPCYSWIPLFWCFLGKCHKRKKKEGAGM